MSALTETQVITENGRPAFAVIPWDEYEAIRPALERQRKLRHGIPHAVVERVALEDVHPVRAWREYLGLQQAEVAEQAGMNQSVLARIEGGQGGKTRKATLERLAQAMGLAVEQLDLAD